MAILSEHFDGAESDKFGRKDFLNVLGIEREMMVFMHYKAPKKENATKTSQKDPNHTMDASRLIRKE
ncbi:hypothetical protein [Echinicola vietnamensis]|uniref:hypothetical protein n=1 Tax=Echinicola vietnamensis TaxID=390884 RepID=UPI0002E5AC10|nr:hypothetical protein [Echinicola vietnamensis]